VPQYCDLREQYYRMLAEKPQLTVFLRGWLNRLNALRREAGVLGFELGTTGPIGERSFRIPDIGVDPLYDL
jgi:hypothetical protein